ncbi:hypothetical protein K435DRAFT_867850 [Dendrothele bispora CBS 962.96]|uniref:Uncharacterized protein n=1 Tax=Dendrothele bispora (strain CBS 962.96) TaxID=1314807 RepID=A0A4S8LDA5_DENBC|nr:hypothetical protein K435DRAFT_867850 [Dendrothele bispora CBS 962.96]
MQNKNPRLDLDDDEAIIENIKGSASILHLYAMLTSLHAERLLKDTLTPKELHIIRRHVGQIKRVLLGEKFVKTDKQSLRSHKPATSLFTTPLLHHSPPWSPPHTSQSTTNSTLASLEPTSREQGSGLATESMITHTGTYRNATEASERSTNAKQIHKTTTSVQPKHFPSYHVSVEQINNCSQPPQFDTHAIGEQCRQFAQQLGISSPSALQTEDHIRGMRYLAKTIIEDIPELLFARLHQRDMKKEFNRLVSLVEHPAMFLTVPEESYMSNPWVFNNKLDERPSSETRYQNDSKPWKCEIEDVNLAGIQHEMKKKIPEKPIPTHTQSTPSPAHILAHPKAHPNQIPPLFIQFPPKISQTEQNFDFRTSEMAPGHAIKNNFEDLKSETVPRWW